MDRIENVLRETLDHKGSTPPPLPDLVTAVAERRHNQRRHARTIILSAAAVVMIAAGATVAALTLTSGPDRPTGHTSNTADSPSPTAREEGIPFAPLPAGHSTLTTDLPMTGSATPTCTAATLRLHVIAQRVVDGATQIQLAAQSVGPHTCRLDRNTIGLGFSATRGDRLLDVGEASEQVAYDVNVEPRVDPGATIIINGYWQNWCGPHHTAAYPVLRPTAAVNITSTDTITPPPCTRAKFGTDATAFLDIDTIGAPGSLLTLAPAVHAPATTRAGTTLHYQVTLTNPTNTAVPLDPCPNYTQALLRQSTGRELWTTTTYQLNCTAIRTIPAHTTVDVQMQRPIPNTAATHTLTLGWAWGKARQAKIGGPANNLHYATIRATH